MEHAAKFIILGFLGVLGLVNGQETNSTFVQWPPTTTVTQPTTTVTQPTTTVTQPTSTVTQPNCTISKADIVFVLDASGSVSDDEWLQELTFTKQVVQGFDIGVDKVRVALVEFSSAVTIPAGFTDYTSRSALISGIDQIVKSDGGTSTYDALDLVRTDLIPKKRENVPFIVIVITDGGSGNTVATAQAANELKATNSTVFAVGVGSFDKVELNAIASDKKFVYTYNDFDKLLQLQEIFKTEACKVVIKLEPTTTPTTTSTSGVSSTMSTNVCKHCVKNAVCQAFHMNGNNFQCECLPGFKGSGTVKCTDINECADGSKCRGEEYERCYNSVGSYYCSCKPGYKMRVLNPVVCDDIDECDTDPSVCGYRTDLCINNKGSYTCACDIGFRYNQTSSQCEDIDECSGYLEACGKGTICYNTVGSFICECENGYEKFGPSTCQNKTTVVRLGKDEPYANVTLELPNHQIKMALLPGEHIYEISRRNQTDACFHRFVINAWTRIAHSVQLQAEFILNCAKLQHLAFSIIDGSLLQHTKNLQQLCPGCHVSKNQTLPVVQCLSDRLIVTWTTDLDQYQPFGADIIKDLKKSLLNYQNSFPQSTVIQLTILNPLPRVITPVKDKSGLFIRPVTQTSCMEDGDIYDNVRKICVHRLGHPTP